MKVLFSALAAVALCAMPEASMGACKMTLTGEGFKVTGCEENTLLTTTARAVGEAHTAGRWTEHSDGTATDRLTGLQWELKTDDGSIHDKDNEYSWSGAASSENDGTVISVFMQTLNQSPFAGYNDWRLPTVDELQSISIGPVHCQGAPCSAIPGETASAFYWSATDYDGIAVFPGYAWGVEFDVGTLGLRGKALLTGTHARAVRILQ